MLLCFVLIFPVIQTSHSCPSLMCWKMNSKSKSAKIAIFTLVVRLHADHIMGDGVVVVVVVVVVGGGG